MGITVYDFMEMFIDSSTQHLQIWSNDKEKVMFDGYTADDEFSEFEDEEVSSIDNLNSDNVIVLNID